MRLPDPPRIHGRDHRGPWPTDGTTDPGGTDPARLNIDSTANVGTDQGVKSLGATAGYALLSDGSDGSVWGDPTASVTPFQPQTEWVQSSDTVTGPGGVSAGLTTLTGSTTGRYSSVLDLSHGGGATPAPLVAGWYSAILSVKWSGATDGDLLEAILELNSSFGGGTGPEIRSTSFAASAGAATGVATNLSVMPPLHLATSDYFVLVVGGNLAGGSPIDYTIDLLVTLLLPGDP